MKIELFELSQALTIAFEIFRQIPCMGDDSELKRVAEENVTAHFVRNEQIISEHMCTAKTQSLIFKIDDRYSDTVPCVVNLSLYVDQIAEVGLEKLASLIIKEHSLNCRTLYNTYVRIKFEYHNLDDVIFGLW